MAEYTKNSPGAPLGSYVRGDLVTDSNGTVWECIVTGNPAVFDIQAEASSGGGYDPTQTYLWRDDFDGYAAGTVVDNTTGVIGPWAVDASDAAVFVSTGDGYFTRARGVMGAELAVVAATASAQMPAMLNAWTSPFVLTFRMQLPYLPDGDSTGLRRVGLAGSGGMLGTSGGFVAAAYDNADDVGTWTLELRAGAKGSTVSASWTDPMAVIADDKARLARITGDGGGLSQGVFTFETSEDGVTWTPRITIDLAEEVSIGSGSSAFAPAWYTECSVRDGSNNIILMLDFMQLEIDTVRGSGQANP